MNPRSAVVGMSHSAVTLRAKIFVGQWVFEAECEILVFCRSLLRLTAIFSLEIREDMHLKCFVTK